MEQAQIAPSVLAADFLDLGNEIDALDRGKADLIHFDVMDGHFVPEISFGETILKSIKKRTSVPTDVHLMVVHPEENILSFIEAGADRVTFHLEATDRIHEDLCVIRSAGRKAGLSICPETPVEAVYPYLDELDTVLLMTVRPGYGGQKFIENSVDRIRMLREEIDRRKLKTVISVDGGIKNETAVRCRKAGAEIFVCGTFVFRGDREKNIVSLKELLDKES